MCVAPFVQIFIEHLELSFCVVKVSRPLARLVQLPLFFSVVSRIVRIKMRNKIYRDGDCRMFLLVKAIGKIVAQKSRVSLEFCSQLFSSPFGSPETASEIALLLIGRGIQRPYSACRSLGENTCSREFKVILLAIARDWIVICMCKETNTGQTWPLALR